MSTHYNFSVKIHSLCLTNPPLAIYVAQTQHYTTEDENVCRTGIVYYGWRRRSKNYGAIEPIR